MKTENHLPEEGTTSELLAKIVERGSTDRVSLGEIIEGAGARSYGLALLLCALPEALPLPVVGLTAVVALPLFVISARMAALGTERPLAGWLRRRSISRDVLRKAVRKGTSLLAWADRFARPRPRWQRIVQADRLLGLVCLVLTIVLALPIPFGNILPALCIVGIAFGMLQRDGMIIAGALAVSALTLVGMGAVLLLTGQAVIDAASE